MAAVLTVFNSLSCLNIFLCGTSASAASAVLSAAAVSLGAFSVAAAVVFSSAVSSVFSATASAVVSAAGVLPPALPVEAELQAAMDVTIAASVIPVIKNLNFLLISFAFINASFPHFSVNAFVTVHALSRA